MDDFEHNKATSTLQDVQDSPDQLEHQWRVWAAKETTLRALLGHYILDGQISEYSGRPTSQRHTTHSLPLPSSDSSFEASNAMQWSRDDKPAPDQSAPLMRQFCALFSNHTHVRHLGVSLSSFNASILVEGLKSLTARYPAGLTPVGVPSHDDLARARSRLYSCVIQSTKMSQVAQKTALIRWHAINTDAVLNLGVLCRSICGQFKIEQHIFGRQAEALTDLEVWKDSPRARLGLLHANSIYHILRDMPLTRLRTMHVPVAIFGAGLIYCAFMLAGVKSIILPSDLHWESVILIELDKEMKCSDDDLDTTARQFLHDPLVHTGANMHLLYETTFFCNTLKSLEQPWGVSASMHAVLQQMLSLCS